MDVPTDGHCQNLIPWEDVSQALYSSAAFEILALIQLVTAVIISIIFWMVYLTSPYPLKVRFGGNAVGRVVTATASLRDRTVISISDYCAASGSTPQRILMTLCTIFSMLSISAALFCEDRLKMWAHVLRPDQAPYFQAKGRILWMFMLGQLGMFFTGNMEVRDGPQHFQTFFMLMHTSGAIGFVTLSPISAWWFADSGYDEFFWLMVGSSGCFIIFSVLSLLTDAYMFPHKPKWLTQILTKPRVKPGSQDIEICVKGLPQLPSTAYLIAERIKVVSDQGAVPWVPSLGTDPIFHQMWLNHSLATPGLPLTVDPLTIQMTLRETAPPPRRWFWSTVFVTLEFTAMILAASSSVRLTFTFARLTYLRGLPLCGRPGCPAT